jgi:DNA polymerase-1
MHNAKFDLKFLYHQGIYPQKVWDTYLGECVLYKGDRSIRKSLEATLLRYNGYQLNKSIRGTIHREGLTERVIRYAAEDTEYLGLIKSYQIARLKYYDLMNSIGLENEFVKVLTYIEYSGIYLDPKLWKLKLSQNEEDYKESLSILNKWIIDNNLVKFIDNQLDLFDTTKYTTISWSSPKQVVELFQDLGIDTKVLDDKTGDLKDSVEAGVLEKQIDKSPIIPIYLKYKQQEKVLSTYGEAVFKKIHPITRRIHTQFTQILDTGRLSSGGKMGEQETINLQNIPRLPDKSERIDGRIYERECFVPEEGNVLIDADYSGQEQIVFANWTKDPDILRFYEDKLGDMHSFISSKIFPELKNLSLDEIKKNYKEKRQIAKSAGFAINYGGDGSTIADNLNLSKEEGDEIYKAYFDAFPGVNSYFKEVTNRTLNDGYITFNDISKSKCFISFIDKFREKEKIVNSPGFWEKYREEKKADSLLYRRTLKGDVSKYFKLRGNISRMALNYPIQGWFNN